MIDNTQKINRLFAALRILLFAGAIGWGMCAIGIFAPWKWAFNQLAWMGGINLPDEPLVQYYFRMLAGAFTFIGLLFLIQAVWVKSFFNMIPFFAGFMLFEAVVLLVHGLRLRLDAIYFIIDVSFCFVIGMGLLISYWRIKTDQRI